MGTYSRSHGSGGMSARACEERGAGVTMAQLSVFCASLPLARDSHPQRHGREVEAMKNAKYNRREKQLEEGAKNE